MTLQLKPEAGPRETWEFSKQLEAHIKKYFYNVRYFTCVKPLHAHKVLISFEHDGQISPLPKLEI